jgi:hypothetical protein
MTEIESTRLNNIETMQDVIAVKLSLLIGAQRGIDWAEEMDDSIHEALDDEIHAMMLDNASPPNGNPEVDALIREWRALEAEAAPLRHAR